MRKFLGRLYRNLVLDFFDFLTLIQLLMKRDPILIRSPRGALEQWKRNVPLNVVSKGKIAILAMRNRTWIEWAVFASCYVNMIGYTPVLIYSEREVERFYPRKRLLEKAGFDFFGEVLRLPFLKAVNMDPYFDKNDRVESTYDAFAKEVAPSIAAKNLLVEENEQFYDVDRYNEEVAAAERMLARYGAAYERLLTSLTGIKRFVSPSGLIGQSAAFLETCARLKREVLFVEAWTWRAGHFLWRLNQPAMIYDVKGWIDALGPWNEEKEQLFRKYVRFQELENVETEEWLEKYHKVQRIGIEGGFPEPLQQFLRRTGKFFFLGMNVVGDSSTLRRKSAFKNQKDWLWDVVMFFRKYPDLNLIVRAHPDEAWVHSKVKLGDYTKQLSKDVPNVYVIGGEEDINTYSIIEHSDVGLVWISTVGLDMALRGKPVICAAQPKYDGLDIVKFPETKTEYFAEVLSQAHQPSPASRKGIQNAKYYQLVVFKEMSLEATSHHYDATEYRLGKGRMHKEQEKFYKILVGELDEKGRPASVLNS